MFHLATFLFLFLFSTATKCACPTGYFTKTNLCDTQATYLPCREYISQGVPPGGWHYFFRPLAGKNPSEFMEQGHYGSNEWFKLKFESKEEGLSAYSVVQSSDKSLLPDFVYYQYHQNIKIEETGAIISADGKRGNLVIGVYNPSNSIETDVRIGYFGDCGDDQNFNSRSQLYFLAIMGGIVIFLLFAIWKFNRIFQSEAPREIENRQSVEVQTLPLCGLDPPQSGPLTTNEIQEYFPKMDFEALENPFHQTACPICLEEFLPDSECRQLFCCHIFHAKCVQVWLVKNDDCPGCRGSVTRTALQESLKKKK